MIFSLCVIYDQTTADSESETNSDATGDNPPTPTGDQEARLLGSNNRVSAPPATDSLGELSRSLNTLIADVAAIKSDTDNIKSGGKRKAAPQQEDVATSRQGQNPNRQKTAALLTIASTSRKESEDKEDSDAAKSNLINVVEGQDKNQAESEDSTDIILAKTASAFESSEEMGPSVSEELASVLKGRFGRKLEDAKLKAKLTKYLIPENCAVLDVPCTYQEAFAALKPYARKADIRLSNIQRTLSKAVVAMTQCTDQLVKLSKTRSLPGQDDTAKDCRQVLADCVEKMIRRLRTNTSRKS